jgi:hypothetical protein
MLKAPPLALPSADNEDPTLLNALTERAEPKSQKCNIDTFCPRRTVERTETLDPKCT